MMTKVIGLNSDGIRHHSCPSQSGPEGPLFSVQTSLSLEFRSERNE